jgi:hypothetical protein
MDGYIVLTHKDGEFLSHFNCSHPYYIVNHGINLDEFRLPDVTAEKNAVVFVGNYGHYPNEHAVEFFFDKFYDSILRQDQGGVRLGDDRTGQGQRFGV